MELYKSLTYEIKDVDTKKRMVEGYASAFGNVDHDGDMMMRGAFSKTISERGPKGSNQIFHLWQHDSTKILGKPTELEEDDFGLRFRSTISETSWGTDILKLYDDGIINEHSVGFIPITTTDRDEYTEIKEVKLFEYSAVTWGANDRTPTTEVKSLEDIDARIKKLTKSLRKGNYREETFSLLEFELYKLKSHYEQLIESLTSKKPSDNDTSDTIGPMLKSIQSFRKQLSDGTGKSYTEGAGGS